MWQRRQCFAPSPRVMVDSENRIALSHEISRHRRQIELWVLALEANFDLFRTSLSKRLILLNSLSLSKLLFLIYFQVCFSGQNARLGSSRCRVSLCGMRCLMGDKQLIRADKRAALRRLANRKSRIHARSSGQSFANAQEPPEGMRLQPEFEATCKAKVTCEARYQKVSRVCKTHCLPPEKRLIKCRLMKTTKHSRTLFSRRNVIRGRGGRSGGRVPYRRSDTRKEALWKSAHFFTPLTVRVKRQGIRRCVCGHFAHLARN